MDLNGVNGSLSLPVNIPHSSPNLSNTTVKSGGSTRELNLALYDVATSLSELFMTQQGPAPTTAMGRASSLSEKLSHVMKFTSGLSRVLQSDPGIAKGSFGAVLKGAGGFAEKVGKYYELFSAFSQVRSASDLGAAGQQYIFADLQAELAAAAAKQLGINTANMSISKLGEGAYQFLTTGSFSAAGTAAEGAAAGALTQAGAKVGTSALSAGAAESGALATGAAAGARGAATGMSLASSAGAVLGAAGAAYGAYNLVSNWGKSTPLMGGIQGASIGAYIGTFFCPGFGTLVGAGIGAVAGGLIGCIKTGKHKDQVVRDKMREGLQKMGLIDKNYQVKLADGTTYDLGKDGGFKLPNLDGTTRRAYQVDFGNPIASKVVAFLNPVGDLMFGGNQKLKSDFIGLLTNAATSNAKTQGEAAANVRSFLSSMGITGNQVMQGAIGLTQQGAVTPHVGAIYQHDIRELFSA